MAIRFARLIAAGALTWAGCCAAGVPDAVGSPVLRLSTALERAPAEPDESGSAPDPGTPGFTERTHQPVEVLRQTRERRERDLLEALAAARRQQLATTDLERRLAETRAQRYANPVVYALAALLALAALAAAWFWQRTRAQRRGACGSTGTPGRTEPA